MYFYILTKYSISVLDFWNSLLVKGMGLDRGQIEVLSIISRVCASLSLVGALSIIISFLSVKRLRTATNRIVVFIALSDGCVAISKITGQYPISMISTNYTLCYVQAFFIQLFQLASVLWTAVISFQSLMCVVKKTRLDELLKYEKYQHMLVWGVVVSFAVGSSFIRNDNGALYYNDAVFYCWIGAEYQIFRIVFLYGPLWTVFFFNLTVFLVVRRTLYASSRSLKDSEKQEVFAAHERGESATLNEDMIVKEVKVKLAPQVEKFLLKSSIFICVFFGIWIWGSINRIQELANPGNPIYALNILHAFFTPLLGFANFVAYFLIALLFKAGAENVKMKKSAETFASDASIDIEGLSGNLQRGSVRIVDTHTQEFLNDV